MKKREMIGFKTTTEIKKGLEAIAEKEDRSLSYIINRIVSEHLEGENSMTDIKAFAEKILDNICKLEEQSDMSKQEMIRNIKATIAEEANLIE